MTLTLAAPDLLDLATPAELAEYTRLLEAILGDWREIARAEQLEPEGDWTTWYCRGGRGSGKTRTGAQTLAEWIAQRPAGDWGVVAPTFAAARDVCVEGPSGLLKALGNEVAPNGWNRSLGQLRTRKGSRIIIDGADDGAPGIQGYNLCGLWGDEPGLWKRWRMAWEESILPALRIGQARAIITGTPKRGHGFIKLLLAEAKAGRGTVAPAPMRMRDNIANLSSEAVAYLERRYAGTAMARQELEGEMLEDVPGALWHVEQFATLRCEVPVRNELARDRSRWMEVRDLVRTVVGVDPATTSGENADETGIVVTGKGQDDLGYVLEDASLRGTPDEWGREAIRAALRWDAGLIVVEGNQGGEMCELTLRTAAAALGVACPRIGRVHAKSGKVLRAEPIAALYDQGRIRHAGEFDVLEDQMCQCVPGEAMLDGENSPDHLDAAVHSLTELMLGAEAPRLRFRGAA